MNPIEFKSTKIEDTDFQLISINGRLDMFALDHFKAILDELSEKNNFNVVFDFQGVSFIISTFLGLLVGFLKKCKKAEGKLFIIQPQEQVKATFKLMHLFDLLEIHDTLEEVLKKIK